MRHAPQFLGLENNGLKRAIFPEVKLNGRSPFDFRGTGLGIAAGHSRVGEKALGIEPGGASTKVRDVRVALAHGVTGIVQEPNILCGRNGFQSPFLSLVGGRAPTSWGERKDGTEREKGYKSRCSKARADRVHAFAGHAPYTEHDAFRNKSFRRG